MIHGPGPGKFSVESLSDETSLFLFYVHRKTAFMRLGLIFLAALMLGGCLSEVNKPIRPNDPWREKAEATSNPMGVD